MSSISHPAPARRGKPKAKVIPAGTPFGRLKVVSGPFRQPPPAPAVYFYRCQCECGNTCDVRRSNLVSDNTTSCGCVQQENRTTHGESGTRLHNIRAMIIQRCCNPNYNQFDDYGGRGITVCPEWRESYEAFRDWALANGYEDGLTIERRENSLGYSPDNCRWATKAEQMRNTRRNNNFTAFGETKCITDWANDPRCDVTATGIRYRMKVYGWPFERAMTTPPTPRSERQHRPFA